MEILFLTPYAVTPRGPFGINLLDIDVDPYRFQLEGFIEEDRYDKSKTTILIHSVEDGRILRLNQNSHVPEYGFRILEWRVERKFDDDKNTEIIAWLKLEDSHTNRIINLRHDKRLHEDSMNVIFEVAKTGEIYVLRDIESSFFVEDVEFRLDEINLQDNTALMTKLIPDSEPISETLSVFKNKNPNNNEQVTNSDKKLSNPNSIEEAFRSFY